MTSSQALTQKLYDAAAAADREAGAGAAGASQPSDDDVVDAEIIDDEPQE
jgi:molecular chaperone DnaK